MDISPEGKLAGSVKISDLEGNIRIEQLLFSTTGTPTKSVVNSTLRTWQDILARNIVYYAFPIIAFIYLTVFGVLSSQPVVASIVDNKQKLILFPRGYYLFSNGTKLPLFGGINGKLHGRTPHEAVNLVIQKYGYATTTVPLSPTVTHVAKKIVLSKL
jgi:hypothetical protein